MITLVGTDISGCSQYVRKIIRSDNVYNRAFLHKEVLLCLNYYNCHYCIHDMQLLTFVFPILFILSFAMKSISIF